MRSFHLISILNVLLSLHTHSTYSLPCELSWIPESIGSIPPKAVESGPGEYIARIFSEEEAKWIAGKIRPSVEKVSLVILGRLHHYESYYVLTNPDNCVLSWEDWKFELINNIPIPAPPHGPVLVDSSHVTSDWVGRGKCGGYIVGGTVSFDSAGLLITHGGREEFLKSFQILTSIYPDLTGTLSSIVFDPASIEALHQESYVEVIGSTIFRNPNRWDYNETYSHQKTIQEEYEFFEPTFEWNGIRNLSLRFHPWFGTSDIEASEYVDHTTGTLTARRERSFKFSSVVTVVSMTIMEMCSYFIVPDWLTNPPATVGFSGVAELRAVTSDMTLAQVKYILRGTGRDFFKVNARKKTVFVRIEGVMGGRFALQTFGEMFAKQAQSPPPPPPPPPPPQPPPLDFGECYLKDGKPFL